LDIKPYLLAIYYRNFERRFASIFYEVKGE